MNGCQFAHDDAAYVLGALPPEERRDYESHLASCQTCRSAVRDVAGLPGLLTRVGAGALDLVDKEPAPATLLPRLLKEARTDRHRRLRRVTLVAAAASLVLLMAVLVPLGLLANRSGPEPTGPSPSVVAMTPVGPPLKLKASLGLTNTRWGTKLHVVCDYADGNFPIRRRTYMMVAVARDGQVDDIGSWTVAPGERAELDANTRFAPDELASVEVRTEAGDPILRATM